MINLADYCTTDSIRSVLGVSPEELPDGVISDPIFTIGLSESLSDIGSDLITAYGTALLSLSSTNTEVRFLELVQAYAAYNVSQQLLTSVRMFAPQSITDSKATISRVADPYKDLRDQVLGSLGYLIGKIRSVYTLLYPSITISAPVIRIFGVTTGIAFDPVTGV